MKDQVGATEGRGSEGTWPVPGFPTLQTASAVSRAGDHATVCMWTRKARDSNPSKPANHPPTTANATGQCKDGFSSAEMGTNSQLHRDTVSWTPNAAHKRCARGKMLSPGLLGGDLPRSDHYAFQVNGAPLMSSLGKLFRGKEQAPGPGLGIKYGSLEGGGRPFYYEELG